MRRCQLTLKHTMWKAKWLHFSKRLMTSILRLPSRTGALWKKVFYSSPMHAHSCVACTRYNQLIAENPPPPPSPLSPIHTPYRHLCEFPEPSSWAQLSNNFLQKASTYFVWQCDRSNEKAANVHSVFIFLAIRNTFVSLIHSEISTISRVLIRFIHEDFIVDMSDYALFLNNRLFLVKQ